MVGREVTQYTSQHLMKETGEELLRVENLCFAREICQYQFQLRAGEILGFAGLVGAGRSEVAQAVFGLDPAATGKLFVRGKELELGKVTALCARE